MDSQAGRGSTFALHLSVEAAQAEARPDGQIRRALVVEDSPVYALVLQQAFESRGRQRHAGRDRDRRARVAGRLGGRAATRCPAFDLVLSDVNLADGPAEDLLSQLNAQTRPGTAAAGLLHDGPDRRRASRGPAGPQGARTVMSKGVRRADLRQPRAGAGAG